MIKGWGEIIFILFMIAMISGFCYLLWWGSDYYNYEGQAWIDQNEFDSMQKAIGDIEVIEITSSCKMLIEYDFSSRADLPEYEKGATPGKKFSRGPIQAILIAFSSVMTYGCLINMKEENEA